MDNGFAAEVLFPAALTREEREEISRSGQSSSVYSSFTWHRDLVSGYEGQYYDGASHFPHRFAFAEAFWPLAALHRTSLDRSLSVLSARITPTAVDTGRILADMTEKLSEKLFAMSSRALVVEMNAARSQGLLVGDCPEARYEFFVDCLKDRSFAAQWLKQYPVLARQAAVVISDWAAACHELLQRLTDDWACIVATFFGGSMPSCFHRLSMSAGDSHHAGHTVCVLSFGDAGRIVYKPRPLAIDHHFALLIAWMNSTSQAPALATPLVLDRGEYGWSKFVVARACSSIADVRRFYRSQGWHLALIYALNGSDFHSENIIAAGGTPVLVDLETLLHPQRKRPVPLNAGERADYRLGNSVLRSGLLPLRPRLDHASDWIDLSGMADLTCTYTPFNVPVWKWVGTDEMEITLSPQKLACDSNLPTVDGRRMLPENFVDEILGGFAEAYRTLLSHKAMLVAPGGPVAAFADDTLRVIYRPTVNYASKLIEGFHPDYLEDGLAKDRFFDRITDMDEQGSIPPAVTAAERRDMWRNDIPYFAVRASSTSVISLNSANSVDHLAESPFTQVQRRIASLSEEDLKLQSWLISAALAHPTVTPPQHIDHIDHTDEISNLAEVLENISIAIAREICRRAIRQDGRATWLIPYETQTGHLSCSPAGIDLYAGLAGIALFLAHAGKRQSDPEINDCARAAMRELINSVSSQRGSEVSIGGFDELGGSLYALSQLAFLLPEVEPAAEKLASCMIEAIDDAPELDIITGLSGALLSFLSAYRRHGSDVFLAGAWRAGKAILRRLESNSTTDNLLPMSFGHGRSGVAFALCRLAAATNELSTIEMARVLMEAEIVLARNSKATIGLERHGGEDWTAAWCRGFGGLFLVAARCGEDLKLSALKEATEHAVIARLLIQPPRGNDSLCHGRVGNLLILDEWVRAGHADVSEARDQAASALACRLARHASIAGTVGHIASSGLMEGMAGVGLGLLRLANPDSPNVLALD